MKRKRVVEKITQKQSQEEQNVNSVLIKSFVTNEIHLQDSQGEETTKEQRKKRRNKPYLPIDHQNI